MTNEEIVFKEGNLQTRGPLSYRIPRCTDIPQCFTVQILSEDVCPNNTPLYSSKV